MQRYKQEFVRSIAKPFEGYVCVRVTVTIRANTTKVLLTGIVARILVELLASVTSTAKQANQH